MIDGESLESLIFRENEDLRKLIQRYPRLFHGVALPAPSQVERGWYPIINNLCTDINQLLDDDQGQRSS